MYYNNNPFLSFLLFDFFSHHQPHIAMHYRTCQRMYRESVGVFGSHIHRLGLFCLQEINSGDMVIEYTGTVIRSTLGEVLWEWRDPVLHVSYWQWWSCGCHNVLEHGTVYQPFLWGGCGEFWLPWLWCSLSLPPFLLFPPPLFLA